MAGGSLRRPGVAELRETKRVDYFLERFLAATFFFGAAFLAVFLAVFLAGFEDFLAMCFFVCLWLCSPGGAIPRRRVTITKSFPAFVNSRRARSHAT